MYKNFSSFKRLWLLGKCIFVIDLVWEMIKLKRLGVVWYVKLLIEGGIN